MTRCLLVKEAVAGVYGTPLGHGQQGDQLCAGHAAKQVHVGSEGLQQGVVA